MRAGLSAWIGNRAHGKIAPYGPVVAVSEARMLDDHASHEAVWMALPDFRKTSMSLALAVALTAFVRDGVS